jgi:hypothetical protein
MFLQTLQRGCTCMSRCAVLHPLAAYSAYCPCPRQTHVLNVLPSAAAVSRPPVRGAPCAEFAQGELFEILEDDQCLPEDVVQSVAKQLVRALHYLHRCVVPYDLSAQYCTA